MCLALTHDESAPYHHQPQGRVDRYIKPGRRHLPSTLQLLLLLLTAVSVTLGFFLLGRAHDTWQWAKSAELCVVRNSLLLSGSLLPSVDGSSPRKASVAGKPHQRTENTSKERAETSISATGTTQLAHLADEHTKPLAEERQKSQWDELFVSAIGSREVILGLKKDSKSSGTRKEDSRLEEYVFASTVVKLPDSIASPRHQYLTAPSGRPNQRRVRQFLDSGLSLQDSRLFALAEVVKGRPYTWQFLRRMGVRFRNRKKKAVPKVAFLFMPRHTLPLARLWAEFFAGNEGRYSIYSHRLDEYDLFPWQVPPCFHGRQIEPQAILLGNSHEQTMTLTLDTIRRLLAHALLDPNNKRFVLVTESCIPLYNFTFIYNRLMNTPLNFFYAKTERSIASKRDQWRLNLEPTVNWLELRKSRMVFQISRPLAKAVVGNTKLYKAFKTRCRLPGCRPELYFIPTMAHKMGAPDLARRDLTWAHWARNMTGPKVFGWRRVSQWTIQKLRNITTPSCNKTCFLFARGFGPSSLPSLLDLQANSNLW